MCGGGGRASSSSSEGSSSERWRGWEFDVECTPGEWHPLDRGVLTGLDLWRQARSRTPDSAQEMDRQLRGPQTLSRDGVGGVFQTKPDWDGGGPMVEDRHLRDMPRVFKDPEDGRETYAPAGTQRGKERARSGKKSVDRHASRLKDVTERAEGWCPPGRAFFFVGRPTANVRLANHLGRLINRKKINQRAGASIATIHGVLFFPPPFFSIHKLWARRGGKRRPRLIPQAGRRPSPFLSNPGKPHPSRDRGHSKLSRSLRMV